MHTPERVRDLPVYLFAQLEHELEHRRAQGHPVVDFTKSDPDVPPAPEVAAALAEAARAPAAHLYPPFRGEDSFRRALAEFYRVRFGVDLDPDREVWVIPGTKAGLVLLCLALLDPGDRALIPTPAFPAYAAGTRLAGAEPVHLSLRPKNGYLPELPPSPPARSRVLFLNYPHNPTGAVAPPEFLAESVRYCRRHGLVLVYDHAYCEITFTPRPSWSILQVPEARDTAVESFTFSKTFAMQGFRLGAFLGSSAVLDRFAHVDTHVHAGVFTAVQAAGTAALQIVYPRGDVAQQVERYRRRQRRALEALARAGWELPAPPATVYLWLPVAEGETSASFARALLEEGVATVPGAGFGPGGEGYLRLSLTVPDAELDRGLEALTSVLRRRRPDPRYLPAAPLSR